MIYKVCKNVKQKTLNYRRNINTYCIHIYYYIKIDLQFYNAINILIYNMLSVKNLFYRVLQSFTNSFNYLNMKDLAQT
jgi:hypothetical protein